MFNSKSIKVEYKTISDVTVYADENMLKTIFRNLISNAIKFTEIGGEITITERLVESFAEITIADNGIGMDQETRSQLFSTSCTSMLGTNNEKGSGLGLLLCKDFIEKLGGDLRVTSEVGRGSEFTFSLPLSKSV